MAAVKSLNRNLKNEDEWTKRDVERHQAIDDKLWENEMSDNSSPTSSGEEEMEVMAARDVIVNHPSSPPPPPPQQPNGMTPLQKAALAAAIGIGGLGLGSGGFTAGYIANNLMNPEQEYTSDDYDLGLLPAEGETDGE